MPAVRENMGNNSRAITGYSKISSVDESKPNGRKDCQQGKDFLKGSLRIFRSRRAIVDQVNCIADRKSIGAFFGQLSVGADYLLRFLPFFPAGRRAALAY